MFLWKQHLSKGASLSRDGHLDSIHSETFAYTDIRSWIRIRMARFSPSEWTESEKYHRPIPIQPINAIHPISPTSSIRPNRPIHLIHNKWSIHLSWLLKMVPVHLRCSCLQVVSSTIFRKIIGFSRLQCLDMLTQDDSHSRIKVKCGHNNLCVIHRFCILVFYQFLDSRIPKFCFSGPGGYFFLTVGSFQNLLSS